MADPSLTNDRIAEILESSIDLDTETKAEIIDIILLELPATENFICPPSLPEFSNCPETVFDIQEDATKHIDFKN